MSNKSSENYLDNLLDSINETDPSADKKENKKTVRTETEGLQTEKQQATSADDEFLRTFEEELESDAYRDYFSEFERELEEEQQHNMELQIQKSAIPENVDSIIKDIEESSGDVEPVPAMPDPGTESAKAVLDAMEQHEAIHRELGELDNLDGIEEIGEPDLAGNGDDDLLDMLANSKGLEDIGDILNGNDSGTSLEEGNSIGSYADKEMEKQEESAEETEEDKKEKKHRKKHDKKNKKTESTDSEENSESVLERLKQLLFGEEEEESPENFEQVSISDNPTNAVAELSEENQQILKELEGEEKPKKEKKKKEKAPKKGKTTKQKPKKEKKPPKPKKEKEKDHTPPLPKGPVIMIGVMVASLVLLILLGTTLLGYSSGINRAKGLYIAQNYTEAYAQLQGMEIKEKDAEMYNRIQTLASVDSQYQSYLVFSSHGDEVSALDSLVCAAGRYYLNLEKAVENDSEEEMEQLGEKIGNMLEEKYGMSMEEASEIYNQRNRTEYSIILHRKLIELGLE